ncbi:MAG: SMP-30/gluconolactonase/LRE family protein, partial [Candidatus Acidiferrales bacterium]
MERRTFMNVTAGAATAFALNPLALAQEQARKTPVLYPDPAVEIIDPRFAKYKVGNAAVERLYTGARWAEGPVWFGDGRFLLFSDIPNNRMLRWLEDTGEVSVFRSPSNYSNGNYRDRQGRLLTCEHDSRRLTRTEYDGTITVLMDRFQGKKLNAPNDLAVHSDGSIWFSDPGYGIMSNYEGHKAPFELPANVYRLDPNTAAVTVVADDMDKPNGLCFSPDEKKIYIVDSGVP